MDFGKVKQDLNKVNFALPPDYPGNPAVLEKYKSQQPPQVYIGCPIWGVKEWLGTYYPAAAREKDFLHYYTRQFNTIELNTTHYRIPDAETVLKWKENAVPGFTFCPKFPQVISHDKRLKNALPETHAFCQSLALLKENLGVSFLQLPPYFSPAELPALEDFFKSLPPDFQLAVEFRNEEFFNMKSVFNKTFELLEKYSVSPVMTDVAGRRDVLHQRFTTDTVLIRWVGDILHPTDYQRLDAWTEKLADWLQQGLKQIYFFVHQVENITSADLIAYLIPRLNERTGLHLTPPKARPKAIQGTLF